MSLPFKRHSSARVVLSQLLLAAVIVQADPSPTSSSQPNADFDGDGLTNEMEAVYGTDPGVSGVPFEQQSDARDSDDDEVIDGLDSWPRDPNFTHARVPESYALIDLSGIGLTIDPNASSQNLEIDDHNGVLYSTDTYTFDGNYDESTYTAEYYDWEQVHTPSFFNKSIHEFDIWSDLASDFVYYDLPYGPKLSRMGDIYFLNRGWFEGSPSQNTLDMIFSFTDKKVNIHDGGQEEVLYDYSRLKLVENAGFQTIFWVGIPTYAEHPAAYLYNIGPDKENPSEILYILDDTLSSPIFKYTGGGVYEEDKVSSAKLSMGRYGATIFGAKATYANTGYVLYTHSIGDTPVNMDQLGLNVSNFDDEFPDIASVNQPDGLVETDIFYWDDTYNDSAEYSVDLGATRYTFQVIEAGNLGDSNFCETSNDLVMIAQKYAPHYTDPHDHVIINQRRVPVEELLGNPADWSDFELTDINSHSTIVGTATYTDPQTQVEEERVVMLYPVSMVPDYDRDGAIREFAWTDPATGKTHPSDYARAVNDDPFYFWINDDDDEAIAELSSDIPGESTPNYIGIYVAGTRDLIDFFPIYIDFHGLLDILDLSKVEVELLEAKVNWLNFDNDYIGLLPVSSGFYNENKVLAEVLGSATKTEAGEGVYFTQKMLERIRDGRGVILLEGREKNLPDESLKLRFSYDGTELFTYEMPLKLSEVEDMFRHVTLVDQLANGESAPIEEDDRRTEPPGLPDSETNSKYFAFMHGYNVSQQQARGWHAEIFKRMYWSGSNAKFIGLTWHGKVDPNYHKAVINAFETGDHLASNLAQFSGDLTIAAHSLGNMVVSHAIADGGFNPSKYFMLNAATPIEAYDSSQTSSISNVDGSPNSGVNMEYNMAHSDWRGPSANQPTYRKELWASNWHELFSSESRGNLTWRNRFGDLGGKAYNFYSHGEDVVENASSGPVYFASAASDLANGGRGAWYLQEKTKGLRGSLSYGAGTSFELIQPDQHGGWMIDEGYMFDDEPLPASTLNSVSNTEACADPIFRHFIEQGEGEATRFSDYDGLIMLAPVGNAAANNQAGKPTTQYKVLAEAIPALSFAAAANLVSKFDDYSGERNFDIQSFQNGWPQNRLNDNEKKDYWLHSDLKNIAYVYLYEYFDKFVEIGELDQ